MKVLLGVFILLAFSQSYAAQDLYPFARAQQAQRFQALTREVRCVVCQNQSLSESYAPLATDLRKKIYAMVNAGKTDQEIKAYLVKRYGEFILLQPPVNKLTLVLWFFPFAVLLLTVIFLSRLPKANT